MEPYPQNSMKNAGTGAGLGMIQAASKMPEYEMICQRIHERLDRIFNKLDPVLVQYPETSEDRVNGPTTILSRFSDIEHRVTKLEEGIFI